MTDSSAPHPRARPRRRLRPARWLVLALVLAGTAAGAYPMIAGPRVRAIAARRGELVQRIVASGRVLPPARIALGSVVTGRVERVRVEEGQAVKAGDVLIELDDDAASAAALRARALVAEARARTGQVRRVSSQVQGEALARARTNVATAERALAQAEALVERKAATVQELDDARAALDLARSGERAARAAATAALPGGSDARAAAASLDGAEAALAEAEVRLAETRIVAPADGLVLERHVEPGDVVQPGQELLVLARAGRTYLSVHPDEMNLSLLRLGQPALASADAYPSERFPVTVDQLAPSVDPARGTIQVKLLVPDPPPPYLRTDMTVSVDIEVGRRPGALTVPAEAVREAASSAPWVMVAQGSRALRRPVRIGVRGERAVEILEGLAEGDLVIPPGAGPIRVGQRVRPRRVSDP